MNKAWLSSHRLGGALCSPGKPWRGPAAETAGRGGPPGYSTPPRCAESVSRSFCRPCSQRDVEGGHEPGFSRAASVLWQTRSSQSRFVPVWGKLGRHFGGCCSWPRREGLALEPQGLALRFSRQTLSSDLQALSPPQKPHSGPQSTSLRLWTCDTVWVCCSGPSRTGSLCVTQIIVSYVCEGVR